MKIQQFDGGLATRQRPQFLKLNEAVEYTNIDSQVGSLAPVADKTATTITIERYHQFYDAQQVWVGNPILTDFLEFQKIMYFTDRINKPQKFNGIDTFNLGIDVPPQLTSIVIDSSPEPLSAITLEIDNAGVGLPVEQTNYIFVNVDTGILSAGLIGSVNASDSLGLFSDNLREFKPIELLLGTLENTNTRDIILSRAEGIVIGGSGIEIYRLYKSVYHFVGALATDTATFTDNVHDISGNKVLDQSAIDPIAGTIQYVMTYYNNADGTESGTSLPSDDLDITIGGKVQLNDLPVSTDPQVDKKRIYRIGGNLTSFTLVEEIPNATTSYLDELSDVDVEGSLATTIGDSPAPIGLSFLTEAYAMLFGAVGSRLVFTPIGEPNNWPALNFLQYEADITSIAPVANGILVSTKFKTHLVTGTGPTSLSTALLSGDQGCVAFESRQIVSGTAMWASTDGICSSSGGYVTVLSKAQLGKIDLIPVDSEIHDEIYYCLNSDKSILAFDFGINQVFKTFKLDTITIAKANDILYGWINNVMYTLFSSSKAVKLEYLSPRFIEGRATELKNYKKVYIYSKGDIILDIIINDKVVATKTLTGEDGFDFQPPVDKQRGFFIQFRLTGTGEVYELEYEAGRRKND